MSMRKNERVTDGADRVVKDIKRQTRDCSSAGENEPTNYKSEKTHDAQTSRRLNSRKAQDKYNGYRKYGRIDQYAHCVQLG